MKIKCQPEDFEVEELTSVQPSRGPFALYQLTKISIGTPEATEAICRRWGIARAAIGYGGMKDRHAATRQYVTIHRGPKRGLQQTHFELEYLGQVPRPFGPTDIAANRFQLILRDIAVSEVASITAEIERTTVDGVPNYFDDQRFGSVGESGQFIAQPWCLGDYERALWLALAEDNRHDRPDEREQKRILRELWGRWAEAKEALGRSHRRSVITYLVDHPTDFRRALALIRVDLRRIYLAAFQSHLWNQVLAEWIRQTLPESQRIEVRLGAGNVWFWRNLSDEQRVRLEKQRVPLPTARQQEMPAEMSPIVEGVMQSVGMELRQLRVKYPRDSFFSKGDRAAMIRPTDVQASVHDDQLYLGRKSIRLQMVLPRGSYATIVVKRIATEFQEGEEGA